MIECVINISEGRRPHVVNRIAEAAGSMLLDLHCDGDHNRSVLTVIGSKAARVVATATVQALDLSDHRGVHPRLGVLDVVPFVPLDQSALAEALEERDRFATWLAETHDVPCFLYGPERTLPDIRREAFRSLLPDRGPAVPHPTAGATAVGARPVLVAYNLWLPTADVAGARQIARAIRGPAVRALGFAVGDVAQVSVNLVDPDTVGPAEIYDRIAALTPIARAELVGLVPDRVRARIEPHRWAQLDLDGDRTIEARLEGPTPGRA